VPPLPPAVADEDIVVSDEDVEFVRKHKDYVGFLTQLDTKPMTR
jgi:nucleolar complex protein 3